MTYTKITFNEIVPIEDEQACVELLSDYLSCLYKNGQILRDYELVKLPGAFAAFVTIPENNALDIKHNSVYANDYCNRLQRFFTVSHEAIGENVFCGEPCGCSNSSWYMLYTDFTSAESPVVCGDCGKEIPLYKLPYLTSQEEHFIMTSWQEVYKSIDKAWMYCLSDRFTFRQLSNPDSQLSKDGRGICRELEKVLRKPVYYYIYHYNKPSPECPSCGLSWEDSGNKELVDFKCDACRLTTDK